MRKASFPILLLLLLSSCAGLQEKKEVVPAGGAEVGRSAPSPSPAPERAAAVAARDSQPSTRTLLKGSLPRTSLAPSPAPTSPPSSGGSGENYVKLNFYDADLGIVIQTIAELIDLNYIISPGVRGRVTIQSSAKIPVSSLPTVLEEILEVNSLSAVKSGEFTKIVPTNQARQKEISVITGDEGRPAGNTVVTKVVPLKWVRPSEVVKILNPFKSEAGLYLAHDAARLLFLTDRPKKTEELMKIVAILDIDTFASFQIELYPVKYADVEELARDLTEVVTMVFAASGRGRAVFKIIPVTQINAMMIISGEPGLARNILSWVDSLDQPPTEVSDRIFVYPLAHAKAEEIAAVLVQIFNQRKTPARRASPIAAVRPLRPPAGGERAPVVPASSPAPSQGGSDVIIVADKNTNSLIVQTTPRYYPVVEDTIRKLDVMPKQVLIEVLIAEITLDDGNEYGLQWAARGQTSAGSRNFNTHVQNVVSAGGAAGASVPGFSYVLTEAGLISAALNAYASDSKLHVLSAPHIMATDNREATINIGDEVPIITTRTTETAGSTGLSGTVTNDIEYRDTGILLKVTPHINEGRFVTLDIRQEVSQAQLNSLGGTDSPIIRKRTAETTMIVGDNQTLVIGGMIDETRNWSRQGIPWLSRIPLIGFLFGVHGESVSKKELVLLITPRVVANPEEGDRISNMVRDRVLTLKEGIERFSGVKEEEK